jgi:hypothetical protein
LAKLEGDDYYRTRYVSKACEGDFSVFLASMEKAVIFDNDENGMNNPRSKLKLDRIVDLQGFMLRESLNNFSTNFILQDGLYTSRQPNRQEVEKCWEFQPERFGDYYYDSVCGKISAESVAYSLFKQVLLIVLNDEVTRCLLGYRYTSVDFKTLLQRLQEGLQTRNSTLDMRWAIIQTCEYHLTRKYENNKSKDMFMGPIAIAAIVVEDANLFRRAVRSVKNGFDIDTFSTLGELICFDKPVVEE